ncbi:MAG: glucosamine-6-phosphate deaminase [Bacillota bacterium]
MDILEVNDYEELSKKAAQLVIDRVNTSPNSILGLATGGTPKGLYKQLVKCHKRGEVSFQDVSTFNLDEYEGLPSSHPNSYYHYMHERFFAHIDIQLNRTHIPRGTSEDILEECHRYEEEIRSHGGIDLQILGIGKNGHIGFNEPGTPFSTRTHIVQLTHTTRKANARYFDSFDEVPRRAITMGINTIMKSKEILLLISGEAKQAAVKRLFQDEISEDFPAAILRTHPKVIVIVDQSALNGSKPVHKA